MYVNSFCLFKVVDLNKLSFQDVNTLLKDEEVCLNIQNCNMQ